MNKNNIQKKVILATGGTGGHIYPAVVVAHYIKKMFPSWMLLIIGAQGGIMEDILDKEKLPYRTVSVRGLKGKSIGQFIKNLIILPCGIGKALIITMQFKPNLVMGFGGYPSAPAVLSAVILRKPIMVIEQNIVPGLANRVFSRFSRAAAVSFEESKKFLKGRVEFTGNPVREKFYRITTGRKGNNANLLVFGGSQGSYSINLLMNSALPFLSKYRDRLKILHQCGKKDLPWLMDSYRKQNFNAQVVPFIYDMVEEFQKADLIICRAGASTLAELAAAGKAAILIPLAGSADEHQRLNAELLAKQGAVVALSENLTGERLASEIIKLIEHPDLIKKMGKAIRKKAKPDAAAKIIELAQEIMT